MRPHWFNRKTNFHQCWILCQGITLLFSIGTFTGILNADEYLQACIPAGQLGNAAAAGMNVAIYDDIVADARSCTASQTCSIAGGIKGCRCPVPVRESAKERVGNAAREASCAETERLYCPSLKNPRCEKQVCIADQVLE